MRRLLFTALLSVAACEPALPLPGPDAGVPIDGGTPMITFATDAGVTVAKIDAVENKLWAALDLDRPAEVPFADDQWDLAFQRFHIRARGGASGDGGVQVAIISDAGFDEVVAAPAGPWFEDQPDGPDDNADLDTVFEKVDVWYAYDPMFHTLTPQPLIYVVRSDRGALFKLQLLGYYDRAGTPGNLTLRFARLP